MSEVYNLSRSTSSSAKDHIPWMLHPSVINSRYFVSACLLALDRDREKGHTVRSPVELFEYSNSPLELKTFIHRPIPGTSWMMDARHVLSIMSTKSNFGALAANYH
jgi:hypothetical protein